MRNLVKQIKDKTTIQEIETIYNKIPGLIFPIFIDVASFLQIQEHKYSKFYLAGIIAISSLFGFMSNSFLVYFSITMLSIIFLMFFASQVEIAILYKKSNKTYNKLMDNISEAEKQIICKEKQISMNNFSEEFRPHLFSYIESLKIQSSTVNLPVKIDPKY